MNNEITEISGTQIAEQTLAECLKVALKCYVELDASNKSRHKDMGHTVRHLANCLSNASFIEFGADDNETDENGFEGFNECDDE